MGCFISAVDSHYYEGDRELAADVLVPKRPSPDHTWNSTVWVAPDPVALVDTRASVSVDRVDQFQFEMLRDLENKVRALRAEINLLSPGRFTAQQTAQVTKPQYRTALIAAWKLVFPQG